MHYLCAEATINSVLCIVCCAPVTIEASDPTRSDYILTILLGLSASAWDGSSTAALKETGAIAAEGSAQRLRDYRAR